MIHAYVDGSCIGPDSRDGGWAVVLKRDDDLGTTYEIAGGEDDTTNNRMELRAAMEALQAVPRLEPLTIYSGSQYVVNTMTKGWKRNTNHDLWQALDALIYYRYKVTWVWVRGHDGNPMNERADVLAHQQASMRQISGSMR